MSRNHINTFGYRLRSKVIEIARRNTVPLIVVGLALAVFLILVLVLPKKDETEPPTAPPPKNVRTLRIERQTIEDRFIDSGDVEPDYIVDVSAEVSGRVEAYAGKADQPPEDGLAQPGPVEVGKLDEGDRIADGQPILYLNTDLIKAQRDQAYAQWQYARREVERYRRAMEGAVSAATAKQIDQAKTDMEIARQKYLELQAKLERTVIVAPREGVLNELPVEEGEYVTPGTPVARIVNMDRAKVVVNVSERDIGYLKLGQVGRIVYGIDENHVVKGVITYISEIADPQTRTTRVELTVDNQALSPDRRLRSGEIVKVELLRRTIPDAIKVPLRAIMPLRGKNYVAYIVGEDGKAVRREVAIDTGMFSQEDVRVLEGLRAGEQIILDVNLVGPGQPIAVVETLDSRGQPVETRADEDAPAQPRPGAETVEQSRPEAETSEPASTALDENE